MSSRLKYPQILFTLVLAIAGASLVLLATRAYGPGVSSDSAFYLSSADNFSNGRGFISFEGSPLVDWPPLYPFVLGTIHKVSGAPLIQIGRLLNALFAGLTILSSALLYKRCFGDRTLWFYLGTAATFLFLPLLTTGANIGTDLIFLWLEVVFFLAASNFLVKKTGASLLLVSVVSACAAMLRWVGYLMILAELAMIVSVYWKKPRKAALYCILFGGLAALPLIAWVVGRNYLLYHTFFGARDITQVSIPENIVLTFVRMGRWVIPLSLTQVLPPVVVWLLVFLILLVFNRKADWIRWGQRWMSAHFLPVLIFSILYYLFITLTIYTGDHILSDFYDDRLQAPLFFAFLIGLFLSVDVLVLPHLKAGWKKRADLVIMALFIVWSLYPINLIYKFVSNSLQDGVVAYNNYNTRLLNHSSLVEFIRTFEFNDDLPIYTNYAEAVYLFTGRQVQPSPTDNQSYTANREHVIPQLTSWPPQEAAYLIWFESHEKRNYFSPDDLSQVSKMELLFEGSEGQVLIAQRK